MAIKQPTTPGYKTPVKPGYLGRYNWKAVLCGLVALTIANVIATQYIAQAFAYQPALGKPLWGPGILNGNYVSIYAPWNWLPWVFKFAATANAQIRVPMTNGAAIAIAGSVVSLIIGASINAFANRKLLQNTDQIHGSARWATKKEIEKMGLLSDGTPSIYIGGYRDEKKQTHYLKHSGPEHAICIAPSGSGKGVGIVVPTLLNWSDSVIVYDIKGENWKMTAGFRQAAGQLCLRVEPVSGSGARFNPLGEIRIGTDREISDAQNVAQMLCRTGKESPNEEHWVETATSLVAGLIIHVCYVAARDERKATIADLRAALTPTPDALASIRQREATEDDTTGARGYYELIVGDGIQGFVHDPAMEHGWRTPTQHPTCTHPFVTESLTEMLNREDKEFAGILSTATKATAIYRDPLVSYTVSDSDFTIDDLVNNTRPVSLYLIVPPSDQERLTPFIRLMFTMVINRLTEKMDPNHTNRHKLLLLIDEFPTLGKLQIFTRAFAYIRGYGLRALLIAQSTKQILDYYGQYESIIDNCDISIWYAPNDTRTAEEMSKRTGTTTVKRAALSFSGNRVSPLMNNVNANIEHVSRPLLTMDEVLTIPRPEVKIHANGKREIVDSGDMLIFLAGKRPIYGRQILFFKDHQMKKRVDSYSAPEITYAIVHQGEGQEPKIVAIQPPAKKGNKPVTTTTHKSVLPSAPPLPTIEEVNQDEADEFLSSGFGAEADDTGRDPHTGYDPDLEPVEDNPQYFAEDDDPSEGYTAHDASLLLDGGHDVER